MARLGITKKKKNPRTIELSQLKEELRRSPQPKKFQPNRSM
jgi:hypothetical protein